MRGYTLPAATSRSPAETPLEVRSTPMSTCMHPAIEHFSHTIYFTPLSGAVGFRWPCCLCCQREAYLGTPPSHEIVEIVQERGSFRSYEYLSHEGS